MSPTSEWYAADEDDADRSEWPTPHVPAQNRTLSDEQPDDGSTSTDAATSDTARRDRYAEAMRVARNKHQWFSSHGAGVSVWACTCGTRFSDRYGHAPHVDAEVARAVMAVADEELAGARADRDADLWAYDELSREAVGLRAEVERLRERGVSLEADLRQANLWSWELKARAEAAEARERALREAVEALHRPWYEVNGVRHDHLVQVSGSENIPADHVCRIGTEWDNCEIDSEDSGWSVHVVPACYECRATTEDGDPGYLLWPCATIRALASVGRTEPAPEVTPFGLTISDDGALLNWQGENYVRQNPSCDSCGSQGFVLRYSPEHGAHFCEGCYERENPAPEVGVVDTQDEGATCLCGEVLRPGFGWHSCNAGRTTPMHRATAANCVEGNACGAPISSGVVCKACPELDENDPAWLRRPADAAPKSGEGR